MFGNEWFRVMKEIQAAREKGLISKDQAKAIILECKKEFRHERRNKMNVRTVRDRSGRVKYEVIESDDGGKTVRDASGRVLGEYRNGMTRRSDGSVLTYGEDLGGLYEDRND